MGAQDSKLWYYPAEGGFLEEIDFGETLSDWQETPRHLVQTSNTDDNEPNVVRTGMVMEFTVVNERISDEDLIAKLQTFETHAQKGKPFSIAAYADKSWAGYSSLVSIEPGTTTLDHGGNLFTAYDGVATLAANDWMYINSMSPEANFEKIKITSAGTKTYLCNSGTKLRHKMGPVLMHSKWFYPFVYLAPSQYGRPIITSDHHRTWTLQMTCWTSPAAARALWIADGGLGLNYAESDSEVFHEQGTLQELLDGTFGSNPFSTGETFSGSAILVK